MEYASVWVVSILLSAIFISYKIVFLTIRATEQVQGSVFTIATNLYLKGFNGAIKIKPEQAERLQEYYDSESQVIFFVDVANYLFWNSISSAKLTGFEVAVDNRLYSPKLRSKSLDGQISELENQIDNQEIEMLK